ncbi:MAG: respiratory nitrate reductase subunit gamma [Nitrospiraceae bacterium]|nr:respiratory nitrate reductase subunit gamma [Nitrospiraceae bacterium]
MIEAAYYKPWILFWICAVLAHGYMDYSFWKKWKSWKRGVQQTSESSWTFRTARIWLMEVLIQRQLLGLSFSRWMIHMLIFWGFLCLAALSMFLFILSLAQPAGVDAGLRDFFLRGNGHALVKVWGDFFGLCLLSGLIAACARRFIARPHQLLNDQGDRALLIFLLWLVFSGFILEGLRLGRAHPDIARYSFVARFLVPFLASGASDAGQWLTAAWIIHSFSGIGLLVYLPRSKLMHSLLGPVVIALNAAEEPDRKDIYWPRIKYHRPTK